MPIDHPAPGDPSELARPPTRSARRLVLAGWALAGLAAMILLVTMRIADAPAGATSGGEIRQAPAFRLETLDGRELTFAPTRGSPLVLNFWASWCVPCREEVPVLTQAAAEYPSVRFVGVVYQDSRESAQAFVTEMGQTYPAVLDPDGRTAIDYGVVGIPMTFFIDSSGAIRSRQVGGVRADDLRRQIEAILP